ncbi:VOC family protein [Dongia sedimenti]|uniref:VOC family protein n=1 Tax=Dongia sedimenti TaxID=3064282 RepID=A0ABU0YHA7_9PROT|nr:VOC family protein [Rhodospirillaceae bacterium R-7]
MHKSQLGGFIIDCKTDDIDAAADFWSAALGMERAAADTPATTGFVRLETADPNGLAIEVQKVDHPSRVHLDIETDDIEAEVARLEKLGAKRVKNYEFWWVLEAPTGQRFCVIRAKRKNFAKEANAWE